MPIPWSRRRAAARKWLAPVLALLALRLAIPTLLAPLVAARLSRAVHSRVEIGDLSVNPLDAVIILRRVSVYTPSHPQPPIAAGEVRIDLQYLPLLHRTLRVREIIVASGHVDLDLPPDGRLGIRGIGRPDPAAELPNGWRFELDRVTLRDTRLSARDADAETPPLFETSVREASFAGSRQGAAVFGKATNMSVDASIGGGRLRVDGHYELREEGLFFDAHAVVADVPLAQVLSRVAAGGATEVSGVLSAKLRWRRDPRHLDAISGRVIVRDARARVAGLDEPAFSAQRGVAEIAAVDLTRRQITIQAVALKGAALALRPDISAPIPLLDAPLAAARERQKKTSAATAPPWGWTIKRLDARDARLHILAAETPVEARAEVTGENIGTAAYWSPLRVKLAYGEVEAAFDGALRLNGSPPLEGRLTTAQLELAPLLRSAGLTWADLVQKGRATVDLTVGFDPAASRDSPFYALGAIALDDLSIADAEPGGMQFAASRIALTLDGFSSADKRRSVAVGGMPRRRIRFSDAVVENPVAQLVRRRDGSLVLPVTSATGPGAAQEIFFESIGVSAGRLTLVDLAPSPPVTWQVAQLSANAESLASPAALWSRFALRGNDDRFGPFEIAASRDDGITTFAVSAPQLALAATGPYLAQADAPLRFTAGRASVTATGSIQSAGWDADATLVLEEPAVADADAVQRALGKPIGETLRELRDEAGNITVRLALASPRGEPAAYVDSIAAALRDALVGAEKRAQPETFSAVSVLFAPGRFDLTDEARRELEPLVTLLGSRAHLVVELSAGTSRADQRWLAEQALRHTLEKRQGLTGLLRALGIRRDRDRIRAALAARARGEEGRLDGEDEELLEKLLVESKAVDDRHLDQLRQARLRAVVDYVSARADGAPGRLLVRANAAAGGIALPAVRAQPLSSRAAATAGAELPVRE